MRILRSSGSGTCKWNFLERGHLMFMNVHTNVHGKFIGHEPLFMTYTCEQFVNSITESKFVSQL